MNNNSAENMEPPWAKFPRLERNSVGWRMGPPEIYYDKFYQWFSALSENAAEKYSKQNPPPVEWRDFYDLIRENPWVTGN